MAQTAEDLPVAARAEALRYTGELAEAMLAAYRHGIEVGRLIGAGMSQEEAAMTPVMLTAKDEVMRIAHPVVEHLDNYAVLHARCRLDGAPDGSD